MVCSRWQDMRAWGRHIRYAIVHACLDWNRVWWNEPYLLRQIACADDGGMLVSHPSTNVRWCRLPLQQCQRLVPGNKNKQKILRKWPPTARWESAGLIWLTEGIAPFDANLNWHDSYSVCGNNWITTRIDLENYEQNNAHDTQFGWRHIRMYTKMQPHDNVLIVLATDTTWTMTVTGIREFLCLITLYWGVNTGPLFSFVCPHACWPLLRSPCTTVYTCIWLTTWFMSTLRSAPAPWPFPPV